MEMHRAGKIFASAIVIVSVAVVGFVQREEGYGPKIVKAFTFHIQILDMVGNSLLFAQGTPRVSIRAWL